MDPLVGAKRRRGPCAGRIVGSGTGARSPALGLDAAIAEISSHPELYDPGAVAACVRLHAAGAIRM